MSTGSLVRQAHPYRFTVLTKDADCRTRLISLLTAMQAIRQIKPSAPLPQPSIPPTGAHRSLQINIDSEDDAKSVIQNLQKVKEAYDFAALNFKVDSVEFCIASDIRKDVDAHLMGAIRWCRTYIKQVDVFEGNCLFPLPHYREPKAQTAVAAAPIPAPVPTPEPQTLGKSQRPVRAERASA